MVNKFKLPLSIAEKVKKVKEPFNFSKIFLGFKNLSVSKKDKVSFIITLVLFAFGVIAIQQVNKVINLKSKAGDDVSFSFSSVAQSVPPNSDLILSLNANQNKIAFVKFALQFDNSKIKLTNEPVFLSGVEFGKVIETTSLTNANNAGKLVYVIGLNTDKIHTPLTGVFPLLRIGFGPNTIESNINTNVNIVSLETEVIDINTHQLSFSITPVTITVNPIFATPTSLASGTPIVTSTPISQTYPVINIKNPVDGELINVRGNLGINVEAFDITGITKIQILLDDLSIKSCSSQTSCSISYKLNKLTSGSHIIKVVAINKLELSSNKTINIIKP